MTAKTLAGIVQLRLKRLAKHFLPPDRQILEKEADLIAQVIEESGVKIGNISVKDLSPEQQRQLIRDLGLTLDDPR